MRRPRTSFLLGLSAQLAAIWLSLSPGLVFCVEQDGRVSLEASGAGGLCGGASIYPGSVFNSLSLEEPVSPHCSGCQDVPLQLEDFVARGRQRIAASFQFSPLPYQATLLSTLQNQNPISAPPVRVRRTSVQRSTVLRI